ncbi:hypothetical protein J6X90_03895 [Candidatus Saccharibacteria bacterium]|nr:hypothetical protein [Candidatus Saccharibacteria bacterium]
MKKQVLLLMFCVVLATFTACGKTGTNDTSAQSPKEETVAKTEAVTEEPAKETAKEDKKVEEKKVEEKVEEKSEDKAEAAASTEASKDTEEKTEEKTEAATTESTTQEVTQEANQAQNTEQTQSTEQATQAETPPATPTYATVIEKYIADGDFSDYRDYALEMGASTAKLSPSEWNIDFYYDGYIITVGTNVQDPDYAYIGTKYTNETMSYACLFPYKGVPAVTVSASGTFIPVETALKLEQVINYLKQNPDISQKPNIPGMEWHTWAELVGQ